MGQARSKVRLSNRKQELFPLSNHRSKCFVLNREKIDYSQFRPGIAEREIGKTSADTPRFLFMIRSVEKSKRLGCFVATRELSPGSTPADSNCKTRTVKELSC